jgi:hypothetical protein
MRPGDRGRAVTGQPTLSNEEIAEAAARHPTC